MNRLEFGASFDAFAEAVELSTPLRLLLLAWADSNWSRVEKLDADRVREFLDLAHKRIVSDQVARTIMMNCVRRARRADAPFVAIERINGHIQVAFSQVAGDDLETFQRLLETLRLSEDGGGSTPAPR